MKTDKVAMTEQEAIDLLLAHKGEVLSATAWEGFCAAGRGCVVTDGANASFLPLALISRFQKDVRTRLLYLVRSYRPATDVVAVLLVPLESQIFIAMGKRTPELAPEAAFLKYVGTPGCPPMQTVRVPIEQKPQTSAGRDDGIPDPGEPVRRPRSRA